MTVFGIVCYNLIPDKHSIAAISVIRQVLQALALLSDLGEMLLIRI